MKGRHVVLDTLGGRRAAALLIDGQLDDLIIDPPSDGPPVPGTIFRGIVDRPMKGQGGVFLKLPGGETGFVRQSRGLSPGQAILAQVTGYAEPGKAVPLTLRLLFKSKYAIVTPGAPGRNVSRQIRDETQRTELTALANSVGLQDGTGLILRSDAADGVADDIAEDVTAMADLSEAILAETEGPVERLVDGADAHTCAWRDWGHPELIETDPGSSMRRGCSTLLSPCKRPSTPWPGEALLSSSPRAP